MITLTCMGKVVLVLLLAGNLLPVLSSVVAFGRLLVNLTRGPPIFGGWITLHPVHHGEG